MQNVHGCQETIETKNYIMKHKKITEMEVEEMKRELQGSQSGHLEEREEEKLEHSGTIRDGEKKSNTASTTEEETETHQQRDQIHKLKEKIESMYYQVTQIAIDKRPRLQKL
jgi:beta-lactam-binding protein with PASTA domain